MNKSTIEVTGNSYVNMAIDQVRLSLELNAVDAEYEQAILSLHDQTHRLMESLGQCGLNRKAILTDQFKVWQTYERDTYTNKNVPTGFKASHGVTFSIPFGRSYLGDVLRAVGKADVESEITLDFWATDEEQHHPALLREAYQQAHRAAQLLAQAAACQLGKPTTMKTGDPLFSRGDEFGSRYSNFLCVTERKDFMPNPDIEPKNTRLECEVTVCWHLEND